MPPPSRSPGRWDARCSSWAKATARRPPSLASGNRPRRKSRGHGVPPDILAGHRGNGPAGAVAGPYEAWERRRADISLPADFADRVLAGLRRERGRPVLRACSPDRPRLAGRGRLPVPHSTVRRPVPDRRSFDSVALANGPWNDDQSDHPREVPDHRQVPARSLDQFGGCISKGQTAYASAPGKGRIAEILRAAIQRALYAIISASCPCHYPILHRRWYSSANRFRNNPIRFRRPSFAGNPLSRAISCSIRCIDRTRRTCLRSAALAASSCNDERSASQALIARLDGSRIRLPILRQGWPHRGQRIVRPV
jgi:hypothetical protein